MYKMIGKLYLFMNNLLNLWIFNSFLKFFVSFDDAFINGSYIFVCDIQYIFIGWQGNALLQNICIYDNNGFW